MHSIIGGIISDYEGMWRSLAAVCVTAFGCGILQGIEETWVRPWLAKRTERRTLPPLGLMLPGFEKAIASHGGRRWSESRGSTRQPVNERVARPRIEPTLDKPSR